MLAVLAFGQIGSAAALERCGPNFCAAGQSCCNETCGLCAPAGGACILPDCGWGRDRVGGHRPNVPLDHPDALLAARAGVQAGMGSNAAAGMAGGEVRALGMVPLGRQFRARAAVDAGGAHFSRQPSSANVSIGGRNGFLHLEMGVGWSIPTHLTWLQALLLTDMLVDLRHQFDRRFAEPEVTRWAVSDVSLAYGLAVTAGRGGVGVSAFARSGNRFVRSDEWGPSGRQTIDFGIAVDADGRSLGVPFGVMVHAKLTRWGNEIGGGLFWLGQTVRAGPVWRSAVFGHPFASDWPGSELDVRVDWMPRD